MAFKRRYLVQQGENQIIKGFSEIHYDVLQISASRTLSIITHF